MRSAGLLARAATVPLVGGCAYDVSRNWVPIGTTADLGGGDGLVATPFRPALVRCVADHHPGYFPQIEAGGGYPISGWFPSAKRYGVQGLHAVAGMGRAAQHGPVAVRWDALGDEH